MNTNRVDGRPVVTVRDLEIRAQQDVAEIVARFTAAAEGVVVHWVEYSRGVLLFVMAPGDERSGEFYVYDRKRGSFWLLTLPDDVFGGYSAAEARSKIREFALLDFAQDPARLKATRAAGNSL